MSPHAPSFLRLRFTPELEREFIDDYFERSLTPLRSAILFGTVLYALFGVLDAWFIPQVRAKAWLIRYAIVCPGCLAVLVFTYSSAFKRYMQPIVAAGVAGAGLGIVAMMAIADSSVDYFYYGGIVLMIIFSYTFIKLRFIYATAAAWSIIACYEFAAIWINHTPGPVLVYNNFIFLSANLLGMFSSYQTERYVRRDFLQSRTVRELEEKRHVKERDLLHEAAAEATRSLMESEAKFRALAQTTTAAIFMHRGGNFIYSNPAGEAMTGYSREEILHRDFWMLVHPDYADMIRERGQARLHGEDLPPEYEFKIIRKNGEERWVRMTAGNIDTAEGSAVIGTLFDITEIKKAAAALEQYNIELELKVKERTAELEEAQKVALAASRAKSEFLANISHELRTPLNSIIGFSEVMKDGMAGQLTGDQRDYCTDIWESGKHLLRLINDILDLSKVEAGMMELELGEVSPRELIEGSLFMFREKALRHRIELTTKLADEVAGITMIADERKLKQVILNLTGNAMKFSPDGGRVGLIAEKRNGDLMVSISDTGIGMAKEDIAKLFQPFRQLDTTLTKKYEGTGLGLHLSKKFIELHGGSISVESEQGRGSVFSFTVPIRLMAAIIKNYGYAFDTARGGREALAKTRTYGPDLVFLDIMMPEMDGYQVCRTLRDDPASRRVPVVMVTALDGKDARIRGLEAGANDFLSKPIDSTELIVRARNLLKVKESEDILKKHNEILESEVIKRMFQLEHAMQELGKSRDALKEGYLDTIFRLTIVAEHKDEETSAHIRRVGRYCAHVAKELGWENERVELIQYAAPMHDIGKIGIPTEILLKPSKLSPEEYALMKTHTVRGNRILSGSRSEFLRMAELIAMTHHERYDGTGYPRALKGDAIPIEGRIMNLADQYDSLRSKRPYKASYDYIKAFRTMCEGDGRTLPSHFDPQLLQVFKDTHKTFEEIYDSFND